MIDTIREALNHYPQNTPINTTDLFDYIQSKQTMRRDVFNVYLARLVKKGTLARHQRGIYFKPVLTVFGISKLNQIAILEQKYIRTHDGVVGFITGPTFLNRIGITTQEPKSIYIATRGIINSFTDIKNKAFIKKAPDDLNETNSIYYQFLFALSDYEKYPIDVDQPLVVFSEYIRKNNLDFKLLLGYAGKMSNQNVLNKLAQVAQV